MGCYHLKRSQKIMGGIGIAPEYHFQIFEPFKRLHGVELPGSGIGLAVCKKITARYGASMHPG
jgi:signal transduction histidine kinase